ncbi:MAG: hypothetical protein JXA09_01015 [Anaerolineae bacterium]|nr:hypothetical protein [Anaerolineae bacterium]
MSDLLSALPGPLAFALLALLAASACYVLQRWRILSGSIAAAACLLLGWIGLQIASGAQPVLLGRAWAFDRPFLLLGREWAFTPSNSAVIAFMCLACGASFLAALSGPQGPFYYPFGMGVVSALIMSVTAQQYVYAVLFLWLASILNVFVLSGGRAHGTTGAVRLLVFTSLAAMLLLAQTAYLVPEADPEALHAATLLGVLGFGLLLMMVPFHGQLVGAAAHTAPMVPAFFLSTFPPVIVHTLLALGARYPALLDDQLLYDVYRLLGTAAVALGGISAFAQRRWGYLIGCALLVDWGAGLIALGLGSAEGRTWMVEMLLWRAPSLLLIGTGLTVVLRASGPEDDIARSRGLLRARLLAVLALIGGLLSLGGFPLTPGFVGRYALIGDLLTARPGTAWVLILGGVGVCLGAVRALLACLGPVPDEIDARRLPALLGTGVSAGALLLVGVLTLHPGPWLELAARMLGSRAFLP